MTKRLTENMRSQHLPWSAAALLLVCATTPVWAQAVNTLKLTTSLTQLTDSNLFRLPVSSTANTAERIGIAAVGLNVNKTYSLQRLELGLNLINYKYQNFSYLSFTASNYNAAWRWALTPRLQGSLTTDHQETLNSFSETQNVNVRNQRINTNTRFDVVYELAGPWHMVGGVSQSAQTNFQPLTTGEDYSAKSANTGLRYVFTSGSTLSYTVNQANGTYLNRVASPLTLSNDSFKQTDNTLRLHWVLSGQSTADISAAHIRRTHPQFAQRDFSGLNTSVNFNWVMTGKTALAASWGRELSSYQTSNTNYIQTDRLSLGPVWQVSPKTGVRLRYEVAQLDYLNSPTGLAATQRSDTTRDTTLSFEWQPHQRIALSASLQKSLRVSNLPNLDFDSNQVIISAQFSY